MVAFHYIVKAKIIRKIKENNEIDFLEFEEKFENENPIIARKSAFELYQNYIDVLLEAKGKKYLSDKQAKKELTSFVDLETKSKIKLGEEEIEWSDSFAYGLGVFLIIDIPKPDKIYEDKKGDEFFIHGLGNISRLNHPDSLISELEKEFEYYKFNKYETENNQTEIVFCHSEEWAEGYLGNGEWLEGYSEPNTYLMLQTPFDWSGLDKPYWWGNPGDEEFDENQQVPTTLEEIIKNGESNQVEFKPALLYNFSTGKAGIGVKGIIAKAICAFLNSRGGFLIIGITDNGETQGLSYDFSLSGDKNEKDYFMLEFDQMLEYFLSFSVKNNVSSEFCKREEKDIFVVTVSPSIRRPIFLNGKYGKEFYIRGEASSRQLTDIEELANYCIDKWGTK
ncbi:MAG TPA: ATP-binding protein [Flavobacteriaceae bacterium]|nr:ATP-binding protein [Flavobacteriaceae bacterium]